LKKESRKELVLISIAAIKVNIGKFMNLHFWNQNMRYVRIQQTRVRIDCR